MLDHLFIDTAGALRRTLDESLLERTGAEDHLFYDLVTGDLVWETSVSLPGDGDPPRVSADISLDWQTWSQAAWRAMALGETVEDPPEIGIEVVFRAQRLATRPSLETVLAALPEQGPDLGGEEMTRAAPVVEEAYEEVSAQPEVALEVAYEGTYRLAPPTPAGAGGPVEDSNLFPGWPTQSSGNEATKDRIGATRQVGAATEATLSALGSWVASTLVKLADLGLDYLPPPSTEE